MIIATDNKQWLNHCRSELDKILVQAVKKDYFTTIVVLIGIIATPFYYYFMPKWTVWTIVIFIIFFLEIKKFFYPKIEFNFGRNNESFRRNRKCC